MNQHFMNSEEEEMILLSHPKNKTDESIFKSIYLKTGTSHSGNGNHPMTIIFVVRGGLAISFDGDMNLQINEGEFFLLPHNSIYNLLTLEDTHLITCLLSFNQPFPLEYSLKSLIEHCKEESVGPIKLSMPAIMSDYLYLLDSYIQEGFDNQEFVEWKKQELFYLIYYSFGKAEMARLLSPIVREDLVFKEFVLKNHQSVKSVQELAQMANYSTSGFEKKFRRCFNRSPYQWMQEQKSKRILLDLHQKKKSLKEIALEYNFSSYQHFANFCKTQYGYPPTVLNGKKSKF